MKGNPLHMGTMFCCYIYPNSQTTNLKEFQGPNVFFTDLHGLFKFKDFQDDFEHHKGLKVDHMNSQQGGTGEGGTPITIMKKDQMRVFVVHFRS